MLETLSAGRPLSGLVTSATPLTNNQKLIYIDTLRGIAILAVIIVHHSQVFTTMPVVRALAGYGQMGVQLFFVASAYTLCHSLHQRHAEPKPISSFFIRRFFRIAPLYYIGLALYAGASVLGGWIYDVTAWSDYTTINVVANLLLIHNFVPSAINGIVPGGWSISVEMCFYLLFPTLFYILEAAHRRFGMAAFTVAIGAALALNALFQVAATALFHQPLGNNSFSYYSIANQMPVFVVGMAVYFRLTCDRGLSPNPPRDILAFIATSLGAFGLLRSHHPVGYALLPLAAALSFVFLFNLARAMVKRKGIIERIGQASYSMYLLHFLFAKTLTGGVRHAGLTAGIPELLIYVGTLLMTVLLSYLAASASKVIVEDAFVGLGKRWIQIRTEGRAQAV